MGVHNFHLLSDAVGEDYRGPTPIRFRLPQRPSLASVDGCPQLLSHNFPPVDGCPQLSPSERCRGRGLSRSNAEPFQAFHENCPRYRPRMVFPSMRNAGAAIRAPDVHVCKRPRIIQRLVGRAVVREDGSCGSMRLMRHHGCACHSGTPVDESLRRGRPWRDGRGHGVHRVATPFEVSSI